MGGLKGFRQPFIGLAQPDHQHADHGLEQGVAFLDSLIENVRRDRLEHPVAGGGDRCAVIRSLEKGGFPEYFPFAECGERLRFIAARQRHGKRAGHDEVGFHCGFALGDDFFAGADGAFGVHIHDPIIRQARGAASGCLYLLKTANPAVLRALASRDRVKTS